MQKIVLKFGLIAGLIISVAMLVGMKLMTGPDGKVNMEGGQIFGYTSMIVALSLIFFGIRSYRDGELGGSISFGKAFKIGLFITLIASVMYVLTWMIYYHTSDMAEEFGAQYKSHLTESMREKGMSETEVAQKIAKEDRFMKIYNSNPLIMFGVTLLEIFPVGLVITLISSFLLKTKNNNI
jgi:Protein of unknown function (DUF4199)